jgi:hypothetical protein
LMLTNMKVDLHFHFVWWYFVVVANNFISPLKMETWVCLPWKAGHENNSNLLLYHWQNMMHRNSVSVLTSYPQGMFWYIVGGLNQCCATFLHSWHTKYCRRVMAHQPHFAWGGGGARCVTFQFHLVDIVCLTVIKKIKTETEQKTR